MRALFAVWILIAALAAGRRRDESIPPVVPIRGTLRQRRAALWPRARYWAMAFGIPVLWLAAIVRAESGWQPQISEVADERAAARGGAWGLGQMTRATAEGLIEDGARPGGPLAAFPETLARWDGSDPRTLLDPDLNLMLSAFHLARLAQTFGPDFSLVSSAYHSGSDAVRKLLAAGLQPPEGLGPRGRKQFVNYQGALSKEREAAEAVA